MDRKLLYLGGIAVLVLGFGWALRVVTAPRETPQLEAPTGFGSSGSAKSASRDDHRKRRAGLGGGAGRRPIPVPRIELRDQPEPEAPVETLGRQVRDPGELDPEETLFARFGLSALPTVFVVDPEGRIVFMESGIVDTQTLREQIAAASG